MLRQIQQVTQAMPAIDGDGVDLFRNDLFDGRLDPFLMLDEIKASPEDSPNAFPVHPHRGIQTLTYLIHGSMAHRDSMGNASEITANSLQWMHTGQGIEHSEIPNVDQNGLWGFQFWLNVPREEKYQPPTYANIESDQIITQQFDGINASLMAGSLKVQGQLLQAPFQRLAGQASLADFCWQDSAMLSLGFRPTSAGVFVIAGSVTIAGKRLHQGQLASLSTGDAIEISANKGARILFFGGEPIGEPIVHRGPFVMTSDEEIRQTIQAYQNGTLVKPLSA